MSHKGKAPILEPRSTCPSCGRYFEGDRCPNPKCRYKRGDFDKRAIEDWKAKRKAIIDSL